MSPSGPGALRAPKPPPLVLAPGPPPRRTPPMPPPPPPPQVAANGGASSAGRRTRASRGRVVRVMNGSPRLVVMKAPAAVNPLASIAERRAAARRRWQWVLCPGGQVQDAGPPPRPGQLVHSSCAAYAQLIRQQAGSGRLTLHHSCAHMCQSLQVAATADDRPRASHRRRGTVFEAWETHLILARCRTPLLAACVALAATAAGPSAATAARAPDWPAVARQLQQARVIPGSALEKLILANQDAALLRPGEAADASGLPLWLRVWW